MRDLNSSESLGQGTRARRCVNASATLVVVATLALTSFLGTAAHAAEPNAPEVPRSNTQRADSAQKASLRKAPSGRPKGAELLPFDTDFSVTSGTSNIATFTVPKGMKAVGFEAKVSGLDTAPLEVNQGGEALGEITADSASMYLPLSDPELDENGALQLTFALAGQRGAWCSVDGTGLVESTTVRVSNAALVLTGTDELPGSVADFFGPGVTDVAVEVADDDAGKLAPAALNLVTSVNHALGQAATVQIHRAQGKNEADRSTVPLFAQRSVVLKLGSGAVTTSIARSKAGIAQLTLSGGQNELLAAARAFGQHGIALASAPETTGLASNPDPTAAVTTQSFAELGAGPLSLEGYGTRNAYIGIAQGAFGRTLSSIEIQLRGVVSSTNATVATVQLLWNDTLVDSFAVDPAQPNVSRDVVIPAASLRSGNGLLVRLQSVTANNTCVNEELLPQVRFDIDTNQSTVIGTAGVSDTLGFADFPQSFAGVAKLAFGEGSDAAQLSAASALVSALQRATPEPLSIDVVSADSLLSGTAPGILVGATSAQAQTLRTPLRLAEARLLSDSSGELTVAVDQPYGALMAVRSGDRSVLVLGAYPGGTGAPQDEVLGRAVSGLEGDGWWQLNGSVRLATPDQAPQLIETNAIVPQDEAKNDYIVVMWWAGGGLLLLIVLGVGAAVIRGRRRRAAERRVADEILSGEAVAYSSTGAEVPAREAVIPSPHSDQMPSAGVGDGPANETLSSDAPRGD